MNLILLVYLALLQGLFFSLTSAMDVPPWAKEIEAAVEAVKHVRHVDKQVCYRDIGCFNTRGPLGHIGMLPQSPLQINTQFYAFTPAKAALPGQLIDPQNATTFTVVNPHKQLVFIVHGYGMTYKSYGFIKLKDALLSYSNGEVGTVISPDWKNGARTVYSDEDVTAHHYMLASVNTEVVGRQIAFLVNKLICHRRIDASQVHCIGYSLGSHVCGFAAKYSRSEYNWKWGRISSLDAVAALFNNYPGAVMTRDDAHFVDVIHTSKGPNILQGNLGIARPYGHVDFYPNGGDNQPRCRDSDHLVCNHFSSVIYFEASLWAAKYCKFEGYPFNDFTIHQTKKGTKPQQVALMGYWAYKGQQQARGRMYLRTSESKPFCNVKNVSKVSKYTNK